MAKYLARLVSSAPLVFLICINDLPKIPIKVNLNGSYKITLFADDTSLIVNNPNHNIFENDINMVFKKIHKRFNTNLLLLKKNYTIFDKKKKTILLMNWLLQIIIN
jgi:hypothetical protein